ncbi:Uncharacterized protein CTYZ_00002070 [Cryptosporidium tyzzeri]|nr:Uncharacterized protein CTYZ_00002070 [Cryptosporidium tyzzeri]
MRFIPQSQFPDLFSYIDFFKYFLIYFSFHMFFEYLYMWNTHKIMYRLIRLVKNNPTIFKCNNNNNCSIKALYAIKNTSKFKSFTRALLSQLIIYIHVYAYLYSFIFAMKYLCKIRNVC